MGKTGRLIIIINKKEYFSYFETALLWNLSAAQNKNQFKIGGGAALTHTVFEYLSELSATSDGLQSIEFGKQSKLVPMLSIIVEDEFSLNQANQCFWTGQFQNICRYPAYIDQIFRSSDSSTIIGTGIDFNANIALGVGYKF